MTCRIKIMAMYTVIPRADQAEFDIAVAGDDGVRQTMLGFKTEADAELWIEDDKKRDTPRAANQRRPGSAARAGV